MGVDHYFHVISAKAYHKLLRPKLIKYYGSIDPYRIIQEEYRKRQDQNYKYKLLHGHQKNFNPLTFINQKSLFKKFFASQKGKKYRGSEEDQQLYDQIHSIIDSQTLYDDATRNHFLRMDEYMYTIQSFDSMKFKVSNMIQVENFFRYTQVIADAFESSQNIIQSAYIGSKETNEILNGILEAMKKTQEETYLLINSV